MLGVDSDESNIFTDVKKKLKLDMAKDAGLIWWWGSFEKSYEDGQEGRMERAADGEDSWEVIKDDDLIKILQISDIVTKDYGFGCAKMIVITQ